MIKNRTFNKGVAFFVSLVFVLGSFSILPFKSMAAEYAATVYSDDIVANVGDLIKIPIKMKDNTGLTAWRINFNYDASALEPISIEYGEDNGCINLDGMIEDSIDGDNTVPGEFFVYWIYGAWNKYHEGTVFYLNMRVKEDYLGSENSVINLSYDKEATFDEDYEYAALNCNPINIKLNFGEKSFYKMDMLYAEWDGSKRINTGESTAKIDAGQKFVMYTDMTNGELSGVSKIRFNYDVENIDFLGYLNSESQLDTSCRVENDGVIEWMIDCTNPEQPKIFDTKNNIQLAIDGRTCDFAFKAKNNAYRGEYVISCETIELDGIDEVRFEPLKIYISKSSESEIVRVYNDDIASGVEGETITIPIYVENNHGIMGYNLSFDYDENILKPLSSSSGSGFKGTIIDNSSIATNRLSVRWFGTEQYAVDGILVNVKFKVLTSKPIETEIKLSYNQNDTFSEEKDENNIYKPVVFDCHPIQLSLNKPAPVLDDFKIKTVSLSLESSITMNFKAPKSVLDEYENYSVRFSCADLEDEVVTEYKEQGDYYVFSYKGVSPQMMNDDVTATLTATFKGNGRIYTTPEIKVSVKYYAYTLLERYADNTKMCALLVDLLNYGAAAQQYRNYQWNVPVNADLTDAQKALGTTEDISFENICDYNYKIIDNPTVSWNAAGLVLDNAVTVRAKFTADSIENKTVKVSCNGRTYTYSSDELVDNKDGTFYVYCEGINAHEMSSELLFAVYDNGVQCSNTMRYSVESYAGAVQSGDYAGTALDNLTQYMMRYGKSAETYVK